MKHEEYAELLDLSRLGIDQRITAAAAADEDALVEQACRAVAELIESVELPAGWQLVVSPVDHRGAYVRGGVRDPLAGLAFQTTLKAVRVPPGAEVEQASAVHAARVHVSTGGILNWSWVGDTDHGEASEQLEAWRERVTGACTAMGDPGTRPVVVTQLWIHKLRRSVHAAQRQLLEALAGVDGRMGALLALELEAAGEHDRAATMRALAEEWQGTTAELAAAAARLEGPPAAGGQPAG